MQKQIYTVTQTNSLIKTAMENNLPSRFTISGQITDFRPHASGHCYFSLKDEQSKLPSVMWKSKAEKIKFKMENGLAVIANGFVDVYVPQGKYQFYVDSLKPAGVGDLQVAFEQLVKRLAEQGLFNEEHKKPLPAYPQRIAIITSESGAAVNDIISSIQTRWPCVKLFLHPVPVQGQLAAEKIAAAIRNINSRNTELKIDILIVGRGGGSQEDLWAFNEEVLARAIFDSTIPLICAVGHEIDVTIADMVADKRASTPTKAGVVAVPDMQEVLEQLLHIENRLAEKVGWQLQLCAQRLQTLLASAVFKRPLLPVWGASEQLDELTIKLDEQIRLLLAAVSEKLASCRNRVATIEPHRVLAGRAIKLNTLWHRIASAESKIINRASTQLTAQANRLAALNPKSVLKRGYSITTNKKSGKIIKRSSDVTVADAIITELAGGNLIESCVIKKQNRDR